MYGLKAKDIAEQKNKLNFYKKTHLGLNNKRIMIIKYILGG